MLYYFPLEKLQERYTAQMFKWVMDACKTRNISITTIPGDQLVSETTGEQFLHFSSRAHYSLTQSAEFINYYQKGWINPQSKIFVADQWHFGIDAIKYAYQLNKEDIPIYTINYAGPFSPYDLLTYRCGSWARYLEIAWSDLYEKIFVGTDWHRNAIISGAYALLANSSSPILRRL
jgi:hypothetical protein